MAFRTKELGELATDLATRFPQMHWDQTLVAGLIQSLHTTPERDGPLTRYLRNTQAGAVEPEESRAVFESHINITSVSEKTERSLVLLGFEPDDFIVPYPRKYARHFTLRLKVAQARRADLADWLHRQTAAATDMLYNLDRSIEWYVEKEIYPLRNSRKYACHLAGRTAWSMTFPFHTNVLPDGIGSDKVAKRADVHVKLCRRCTNNEFRHSWVYAARMEHFLTEMNFYSVVSGAGNTLFTGQFAHRRDAHLIFSELDRIARTSNSGIAGITMESCVGLERSPTPIAHGVAEVGPILTVHDMHYEAVQQ
jgi:hypothetical protein